MPERLPILFVDDQQMFAEGLRALLRPQPNIALVGEARTADEALGMIGRLRPKVVLIEVSLPGMDGAEAVRRIHALHPDVRVVALLRHTDPACVERIRRAGADAWVCKKDAASELIPAIEEVTGQAAPGTGPAGRTPRDGPLTRRERQVLVGVAEGATVKEIAAFLGISPKTAHVHRANASRKLGLRGTADVVRWAHRQGLVDLDR